MQYRMDAEGRLRRVTPEMVRDELVAGLVRDLQAQVGAAWVVQVEIPELPYYLTGQELGDQSWEWLRMTVTVKVVGDGSLAASAVDEDAIDRLVRGRVWDRVGGRYRIESTVFLADAATVAALRPAPAPAPDASTPAAADPAPVAEAPAPAATTAAGPASTPPPAGQRRYVVQEGDTLALISSVFYGDAASWRRIVDANPGLDPAALPVGQELVIP